jgi:zinc protease
MKWLILLLFSGVSMAQTPEYFKAFESREIEGNLTRVVLRNGLTIVIEEQSMDPLATVVTYIQAGYSQEEAGNIGVSHLLERLYRHRSEVVSEMVESGAVLKITTHYDSTSFSSSSPAENVLETLDFHAALLQAPEINLDAIGIEVEILLKERLLQLDLAQVFARQKLLELAYPKQRWGGLLSTEDRFTALARTDSTLQQLTRFHEAHYHPGNVILVVSGAVRRERILEKVVELYGSMRSSKEASPVSDSTDPSTVVQTSFRYLHLRGNHLQPYLLFAYRIPGLEHDDYYPLLVLSYMLGRGRGALLRQSMLGEEGTAADVRVEVEALRQKGTLFFLVTPHLQKIDGAEVQVLAQLEILKRRGIPIAQLDRAKALLLKDHYLGLQSLEQRASSLAHYEALGDYLQRDREVERLTQVTSKQVSDVLERYLTDSNLSLVEYFPQDAELRTFTSETLLETLRLLVPSVVNKSAEEQDPFQVVETKSSFQPPEFRPSHLKLDLKHTSILRGPVIHFREVHTSPLVHLGFFFPGGRIKESSHNSGITEVMLRALLRNAASREDSLSWIELERLGAEIRVVNETDFFGFQAIVFSTHLKKVFETLIDWTRSVAVKEEDLIPARQEVLAFLNGEKENRSWRLLDLTRRRVFHEHPYGLDRYGTLESVSGVPLKSVQSWVESEMTGVHPWIVVNGDIEGTSFLRDFVSTLSDSSYEVRKPIKRGISRQSDPSNGELIFEEEEDEVVVAFPGPARGTRDEAIIDVLEGALFRPGGRFAISLRDQGLAYQLRMFHQTGLNGGALFVSFAALDGKRKAARDELFKQLSQLQQVPLREAEFLNSVVGAITRVHVRQQSGEDYIVELGHHVLAKEGVDPTQQYLTTLRRVKREDLMSLAKRYFTEQETEVKQETEDGIQNSAPQKDPEPKSPSPRPSLR